MSKDNELASALQTGVPLHSNPWGELGKALSLSETDVLAQLNVWKADGILREISAVFEGNLLGYESALVAGCVDESRLEQVGALVSECPTVTHNYVRNHAYNLWFTIAMPEEIGVDKALSALANQCQVKGFFPLRRTTTFKIGVRFDLETMENTSVAAPIGETPTQRVHLDEKQKRMVRALQSPLPLTLTPFADLSAQFELDEDELISFARTHLGKAMRRYVATFRHRKMGVRGNAMLVLHVPDGQLSEIGNKLATHPVVSHCYARTAIEGFPYSLYAMVHGADEARAIELATNLAREVDVSDFCVLMSTRELKKVRLRYFLPELNQWWEKQAQFALR